MADRAGDDEEKESQEDGPSGIAHIQATFNNTIITITDKEGNVVTMVERGHPGSKGSRKSTPFCRSAGAEDAAKKAMNMG